LCHASINTVRARFSYWQARSPLLC